MESKKIKQNKEGFVSIVLTYYNGKDFIIEQLESIIRQTYKNWELIIIDDCSTDGSEDMLRDFIEKNSEKNVIYIRNEKNLGLAKNFERGLRYISGEYIAVCDPDDVWFEDKLERQVDFLKKNSDYGMVYSGLVVVDENLKKIRNSFAKNSLPFFSNPKDNSFEELIDDNHITAPTILFRAGLKDKLTPFSKYGMQDHWIAALSSMCTKIGFLDQPTIYYRQHSSNMVSASKLSLYYLLFKNRQGFLEKHLRLKRNSLSYLVDMSHVGWIPGRYRKMINDKINKTRLLVECLTHFSKNNPKCATCLKALWKLKAYREIMQVVYFRLNLKKTRR